MGNETISRKSLKLGVSSKNRSDQKKTKYKNKLSALIKGLSSVTKPSFEASSSKTTLRQSKLNPYIVHNQFLSIDKQESRFSKGSKSSNKHIFAKNKAMVRQNYSLEELTKKEASLTKSAIETPLGNSSHKYCLSLVKSNKNTPMNSYLKPLSILKLKDKSKNRVRAP